MCFEALAAWDNAPRRASGPLAQDRAAQPRRADLQRDQAPLRVVGMFPNTAPSSASSEWTLLDMHGELVAAERCYLSEGSMAKLNNHRRS